MTPDIATGRAGRRSSPFAFLWASQFLSQFGDSIFQVAFIWLILDLTGSKASTGLATTISYLPSLLFGIVAGFLIDRWNRRGVMAAADLTRGLLLAAAGALLWRGALTAPALTAIAFVASTAACLFNPARDSLLPELVEPERLTRANAWVQISQQAAFLAGPLAAGALIQAGGVVAVFPAGVLLFGGSLGFLLALRGAGRAHRAGAPPALARDFVDGFRAIAADRTLVLLLVITALDNLVIMGPAILGNAVMVRDTLKRGAASYALVEAVYGIGMIAGSLAVDRLARRFGAGRVVLWGIFLDGITYAPLFFCRSYPYFLVVSLLHSIAIPLITVPRASILQRIVPAARLGRVFALTNFTVYGMTALSLGLAGIALDRLTAPQLFGVIGLLGATTGLVAMTSARLRAL
ncbi:MAG TPA: MFS transporter [Candidatus Eisenbacteria bacterium]